MDLVKQLDQDMITAMKNKEKERLTVIREVKSAMKLANIDQKKERMFPSNTRSFKLFIK